jgi:DNA-binding transcriptional MerR regulator
MDFLAHVAPLNTLPDINTNIDNSYVKVFKSTSQTTTTIAGEVLAMQLQQTKSESPEKTNTEAKADGDDDGDGDGENFQYVIAEITCGGAETVLKKLEQLEKDCYFLCSRACPSLSDADFQVLATVAFVAVVSPKLKENLLRNRILSTPEPLPLLRELYNCGRFVWIEHTQTLGVVVKEIGNRLDSVVAKVSEQNEATQAMKFQLSEQSQDLESKLSEQSQALESKLSEQSQAVEAKLSEQSQTIKALSEQLALFQQKVLERLPER